VFVELWIHAHAAERALGGITFNLDPLRGLDEGTDGATDQAIADRCQGRILLNANDQRMDRRAATRQLWHLVVVTRVRMPHRCTPLVATRFNAE
jgi:hypothetical protein